MTWKDYEHYIHRVLSDLYPGATITHNVQKIGVMSGTKRQIDILIEVNLAGYSLNIVVECKYLNKKIDIKVIESFIGFLHDVKANKGVLITNRGFTKAAQARTENDSHVDLDIKIINFDRLEQIQSLGGIVFKDTAGVFIEPPTGWILDFKQRNPFVVATLYSMGLSFEQAIDGWQYIYVYITIKTDVTPDLVSLFKYQECYIQQRSSNCIIEYFPKTIREDNNSILRVITYSESDLIDHTLFIDFKDFIFYCTLVTSKELQKQNLKRLEQMMAKVMPLEVTIQGSDLFEGWQRT